MRHAAVVSLLWATLSGCEPAREASPAPADQPTAVPAAQIRFYPVGPRHDLPQDVQQKIDLVAERAIGIVVPRFTKTVPDELTVVNDTAHEVQTVARLRFYPMSDGGWTDTLWAREPGLHGQLLRATHDDYGLPVLAAHGEWLRVAYAYSSDGEPKLGWVRFGAHATMHDYDTQLFDFMNSLTDAPATEFFKAPNGARAELSLEPSHMIEVLRLQGDWIQVNVVRPDTSPCTGTSGAQVRNSDTVWIRRYNAQGRRQISTAVAGC